MSDAGGIFISEKFEKFCKKLNKECTTSSSYHHISIGLVEACSKLVKHTMKKFCDTKYTDKHLALLHVRTMLLGPGIPSPATLLFKCPTRGMMPIINRAQTSIDNEDEHHKTLVKRETKMI